MVAFEMKALKRKQYSKLKPGDRVVLSVIGVEGSIEVELVSISVKGDIIVYREFGRKDGYIKTVVCCSLFEVLV
jgi:hypothetical protein